MPGATVAVKLRRTRDEIDVEMPGTFVLQDGIEIEQDGRTFEGALVGGGSCQLLIDCDQADIDLNSENLDDLLSLEHVGDPDRTESGYFAAIDIYDPIIDDICLLTDGLRTAIAALPARQRLLSTGACPKGSNHARQSQAPMAGPLAFVPRGNDDHPRFSDKVNERFQYTFGISHSFCQSPLRLRPDKLLNLP